MNKGLPSSSGMCAFTYVCFIAITYKSMCVPDSAAQSALANIQHHDRSVPETGESYQHSSFSVFHSYEGARVLVPGGVVSASKRNLEQYLAAVAEEKRREAFKPPDPHDRGRCFTAEVRVPSSFYTTYIYIHTHVSNCFLFVLDQFVSAAPGGGDSSSNLLRLLSSLRQVGLAGSFSSDAMKVRYDRIID